MVLKQSLTKDVIKSLLLENESTCRLRYSNRTIYCERDDSNRLIWLVCHHILAENYANIDFDKVWEIFIKED